jgi:hypothetical protein
LTFTTESDKIEGDTAASTPKGQIKNKKKGKIPISNIPS